MVLEVKETSMSRPNTEVATLSTRPSLLAKVAAKYSVDPHKMLGTLKATAFKGQVSDEQMMALLVVADQYDLNPWTKEIYAFPDKNNGIVPVVGVDGWSRIINSHPQFDGVEFRESDATNDKGLPEWIECTIYRKDRAHPTTVREYMAEVYRNTGPWNSHPRRMGRHKSLIQCARLAFGFVGIYDQDEAERIREAIDVTPERTMKPRTEAPRARTPAIETESHPDPALDAYVPQYDEAAAVAALKAAESVEQLDAAWGAVCEDYRQSGRALPIDVEAARNDRREALANG